MLRREFETVFSLLMSFQTCEKIIAVKDQDPYLYLSRISKKN